MEDKKKFMAKAIELSINSANTVGGPFGSVIVKDDKIIEEGSNTVFALLIESSIAFAINFFLSSIFIFYFIFNFINTH
jgi:hypothetical protein